MAGGIHKTIAMENEAVIAAGSYTAPSGKTVVLTDDVRDARQGTRLYAPSASARLVTKMLAEPTGTDRVTAIEVTDESSMVAARRLVVDEGCGRVAVQNFASARNPGGGYIGGARAQEEDLCRVSALYTTLLEAPEYYAAHRADRSPLYSHRVIFSPDVPVFRDHQYRLLDEPYAVSFLTSPAPNAGVVARDRAEEMERLPELLRERAACVLAVAAHHGIRTLVLGAWGCGVFRNDPADVAEVFKDHLSSGGLFENRFDRVVFAVLDRTPGQPNLAAFRGAFGDVAGRFDGTA
jgi:uncharacterized protein (TIGR02452 family)